MMTMGLGSLTTGIFAGALLTLAVLLAMLAWRGKDRTAKWTLAFSGASTLLLALSQALLTLDIQVPVFRLLTTLMVSASILSLLFKLPGWLQVRPGSETIALVKEKEHVLGKLRETEAHLKLLVEGVEEMTRLLRASLSRNATLRWEPAPDLPSLEADPAQIQQVIMNLVVNASDAVAPRGGIITLRTGLETLDREGIDRHFPDQALRPGPHVTLEVADNGPGMAPQVKERIFDPFFTTKFTGRGLGLSAVQGILRSHLGGIRVASKQGEGTTFKLFFPVGPGSKRAVTPEPPACQVRFADYRGSGTVLVVDDEEALRAMAGTALCRLGFKVLEARDGQEALEVFQANREQISLILMDLTMPRMDGEVAFRELRRAGARIPILLSSGFGPEEALQRFTGKGLAGFLQKPYRFQALVDAVRDALGEHCGEGESLRYPPPKPVLWLPEFATGHPVIDAQHRGLVDGFNRLVATTLDRNGDKGAPKAAFYTLIGATLAHFGIEESLMADAAYPESSHHKDVHTHLTNQIQGLAAEFEHGLEDFSPPILNFLEGWLLCHIQYEDKELVHFLTTKGL
jgi:hemerythrin-like metal-binding protein